MESVTKHTGSVINENKEQYFIKICSLSACVSCKMSDSCPSSDKKDKLITINKSETRRLEIGEDVTLLIDNSNGTFAYIVAYTAPVLIIVVICTILYIIEAPQIVSALAILASITIYFIGLYFMREKLEKRIKIRIKGSSKNSQN